MSKKTKYYNKIKCCDINDDGDDINYEDKFIEYFNDYQKPKEIEFKTYCLEDQISHFIKYYYTNNLEYNDKIKIYVRRCDTILTKIINKIDNLKKRLSYDVLNDIYILDICVFETDYICQLMRYYIEVENGITKMKYEPEINWEIYCDKIKINN